MKRILTLVVFAVVLQFSAQAQLVHYGGRMGFGAAYVSDDLLSSPILGFNLGGYVDYMFTEWRNPWAENIYLQTGLNIVRRGGNFQQVLPNMQSLRRGYYHSWYAQIPLIAGFKYEIPQLPANNFVNFFLGPTLNVGVLGSLWDSKITPGMPQTSDNYDTYITGNKNDRRVFKHIRRFDVGIILGVGYQWHNYTVDLYMDHGFIALMKKDDVLIDLDQQHTGGSTTTTNEDGTTTTTEIRDRNAYTGTNHAIMLSFGYQLPINR